MCLPALLPGLRRGAGDARTGRGGGWSHGPAGQLTGSAATGGIGSPARGVRRLAGRFDDAVEAALDQWRGHPAVDRIFYGASALGDHSLIWLILGALRGLRAEHHWKAAVRLGAGMGVESAVVNLGIKSLFRRSRPAPETSRPLHLRQPKTSSFPSGHATSAFVGAGLLAEDDPLWPLYYAVAVVVATSRVYVRIHHASDVLAGVIVGIPLGRLGRRLFPLPRRG